MRTARSIAYVIQTISSKLVTMIGLTLVALHPTVAQTTYTITDLGTLGGTFSWADYVNANGAVSGYSTLPGDTVLHGFLWERGVITDLGPGLHGPNSIAGIVNASEVASGNAQYSSAAVSGVETLFCGIPFVCHGVTWTGGVLTDLGTTAAAASRRR